MNIFFIYNLLINTVNLVCGGCGLLSYSPICSWVTLFLILSYGCGVGICSIVWCGFGGVVVWTVIVTILGGVILECILYENCSSFGSGAGTWVYGGSCIFMDIIVTICIIEFLFFCVWGWCGTVGITSTNSSMDVISSVIGVGNCGGGGVYNIILANNGIELNIWITDVSCVIVGTWCLILSGILCNVIYIFCCVTGNFGIYSAVLGYFSGGLGVIFIMCQVYDFLSVSLCTSNGFLTTTVWVVEVCHLCHVVLGLLGVYIFCMRCVNMGGCLFGGSSLNGWGYCTLICIYWHFVDIVWCIVVRFIYVSGVVVG